MAYMGHLNFYPFYICNEGRPPSITLIMTKTIQKNWLLSPVLVKMTSVSSKINICCTFKRQILECLFYLKYVEEGSGRSAPPSTYFKYTHPEERSYMSHIESVFNERLNVS